MLHAKELRFGNKVYNQRGEVITVQQILCNTIIYDTQMNISSEPATAVSELAGGVREIVNTSRGPVKVGRFYKDRYTAQVIEVIKEAEFHEVNPIQLTEKILQKCGFRNFVREEWIVSYGNSHIDFEFTEDGLRLRNCTPVRASIQYLHQLQNFFFAITGCELEVNL